MHKDFKGSVRCMEYLNCFMWGHIGVAVNQHEIFYFLRIITTWFPLLLLSRQANMFYQILSREWNIYRWYDGRNTGNKDYPNRHIKKNYNLSLHDYHLFMQALRCTSPINNWPTNEFCNKRVPLESMLTTISRWSARGEV